MILYRSILDQGSQEQIIEKSRFIAYAKPVSTQEEANQFIKEIKTKHKDATHNVPAMVIGDKFQIQWASDDGEPQGTSGAPMVQMMVKEGFTNVAVVVTRYFGGIKLGPGGLVRAYTSSAKLGLIAAGVCNVAEVYKLKARLDYTYLSKIQSLETSLFHQDAGLEAVDNQGPAPDFVIENIDYQDVITINFAVEPENQQAFKEFLVGLTGGKVEFLSEALEVAKVPFEF